jgi:hypothetical protein
VLALDFCVTETAPDENLMKNDDSLAMQMNRDQWLHFMRAYREGELNQEIPKDK